MSRQFATNVTTIYDIFCPVPFLPSPFGFRRLLATKSPTKSWELSAAKEFAGEANGFANERAKILSSLQKLLANGSLRQNSLAIANAKAWCTQSEGKKYTPKGFSALKTQVPQQAKKRFGVYQKACFQGRRKENTHTHQRAFKVFVWEPLRAVLVYRFWPPTQSIVHRSSGRMCPNVLAPCHPL